MSTIGGPVPLAVFELLPAIDIRGGRVVRLRQGDFNREVAYEADPVAVAARFVAQGATWLHVVDLDGARDGEPRQLDTAAEVVAEVHGRARVELGGGCAPRSRSRGPSGPGPRGSRWARRRYAIPSSSARSSTVTARSAWSPRSTSATGSRSARAGARTPSGCRRPRRSRCSRTAGVTTFEVTSIERDGLLEGPDLDLLRSLVTLGAGPDHRVGRHRLDRGRACGPGDRLRGRDRRQRALRGPVRRRAPRRPPWATRDAAPADASAANRPGRGQCPSRVLLLVGLDDLVGEVRGHVLVVVEGRAERAPPAGQRAQLASRTRTAPPAARGRR